MKKSAIVFAICSLAMLQSSIAQVQRKCGSEILKKAIAHGDPVLMQKMHDQQLSVIANSLDHAAQNGIASKATAANTIPVVFHVILTQTQYNRIGGAAGVAQRIDSQMVVINRDFNRGNSDSTLIPAVYKPLYGNPRIRFALAKKKPSGTSTIGYELKVLPTGGDTTFEISTGTAGSQFAASDAKYLSSGKGFDAWDVSKYLNIWIAHLTDGGQDGILGVTVSPNLSAVYQIPNVEEGVVLTYNAFGKRAVTADFYFAGVIDKGRTLTHELGHFFELAHIWGDDNGLCPTNGGSDDGIADTPPQASDNYGCPTFPHITCTNGPGGDMFMNYMDYVDDRCMEMFSIGQALEMFTMIQPGQESYPLTQNPQLLSVANVPGVANNFNIGPNPTSGNITITFATQPLNLTGIEVVNMVGQAVQHVAPVAGSNVYSMDLSALSKGIYFVKCRFNEGAVTQKIVLQ